jgi:uncharacterized protein (TIGR02231 family)
VSEKLDGSTPRKVTIADGEGSRVSEAVVFTDRAFLKRRVTARAEKGVNRYLVEVQAFKVDEESVQGAVFGEGSILGVQYREVPVERAPQEEARALRDSLDKLKYRRKALDGEIAALEKQGGFLDGVSSFAGSELPKKMKTRFPNADQLQGMLQFLEERYGDVLERRLDAERRAIELDREIRVAKSKLKKLRPTRATIRKAIEVLFETDKDQEIVIEVSYVAWQAGWEATYKVDVPGDLSSVRLTMFARIEQATGEAWTDVKLSVSNAVPMSGAALPEPEAWRLRMPRTYPPVALDALLQSAAPAKAPGLHARRMARTERDFGTLEELEVPAAFTEAVTKELPTAFEYEVPWPVTLHSGGDETMLPLYTKEVESDFFIYAVPRVDPHGYLVARAKPDSALVAGRLNVYLQGRFVGDAKLTEKRAGEELLAALGVERGVKIQRERITDKKTETFFGKVDRSSVARELEYRTGVENLKEDEVRVRLIDAVPVSDTDRIQVKGVELTPHPAERDYREREGLMLWDLRVPTGETAEIRVRFSVKHPRGAPPEGLG